MEQSLDGNNWQLIHLLPSEWVWRQVWKEDWDPSAGAAAGQWITGCVPGDVTSDALDAGLIANPYVDMQSRAAEWTSERDWIYRKQFTVPSRMKGNVVRLRFEGVDYSCHVYLNGELLGKHTGMFVPFEYDVSHKLRYGKRNTLVVVVEHMPPVEAVQGQIGWSSEARVWKSRFAYNWDWCTRLVPLGIWQSVRLIATDHAWIDDVWTRTKTDDKNAVVSVTCKAQSNSESSTPLRFQVSITSPKGKLLQQAELEGDRDDLSHSALFTFTIPHPELWFPNGMGDQPLYKARVDIITPTSTVVDSRTISFGIRTIRAIANEGAAPDALPYTIEVNGRKMFVKGWNWAPVDNLYGRPQSERYERLLTLAQHAHCNLLRVWGGGLLERETFYDLCDRMGILIWQEFHQSSSGINNRPPEDEAYLAYIEQQARQMIPLRRNHPALAIWCGGNELMSDDGAPLTDQHPALAKLKSIVNELDPDRLWLPTSSTGPTFSADPKQKGTGRMHDVHGPWQYQGAEGQYQFFNNIDALYHSEFGAEGAANLFTLRKFISPQYEWPPDASNPAWIHHGSWWLHREKLELLFGKLNDIEAFIRASQWMQAEGLRYAIESNRRRKWQCSGTSPWQLNEAFPNTACTNSIDYLGLTKPAYWWVRRAYEPIHISARYERITPQPRESWHADIWVNNSLPPRPGCHWTADLLDLQGKYLAHAEGLVDLQDDAAMPVGELVHRLSSKHQIFLMLLALRDSEGNLLSRNEYVFSSFKTPLIPLLQAAQATLTVRKKGTHISIKNTSDGPALFIQLMPLAGQWILPSDDYFCMAPGEMRDIEVQGEGKVSIAAWNSASTTLKLS